MPKESSDLWPSSGNLILHSMCGKLLIFSHSLHLESSCTSFNDVKLWFWPELSQQILENGAHRTLSKTTLVKLYQHWILLGCAKCWYDFIETVLIAPSIQH